MNITARPSASTILPIMVGLLFLALLLFMPPYRDSFVGDDYVQQWRIRKLITDPVEVYNVLNPNWTDWYYRPLQHVWFLGTRLLFGLLPAGYYYLQSLWHLLSVSLIFALARKVGIGRIGVLLTSILFAINAEHQLTVDWISSIGVVAATGFSLAAAAVFLQYLRKDQRPHYLIFTCGFWLAALLFHESAIILPLILLSIWWTEPNRPAASKILLTFGLCLTLFGTGYVYIQLMRENANLGANQILAISTGPAELAEATGRFIIRAFSGWLAAEQQGQMLLDRDVLASAVAAGILLAAVVAFVLLYRWGNRAVRLGLIWTLLQLAFILVVLWLPRPDLLGGRHLYPAWAGLSLTLGAAADKLLQKSVGRSGTQGYSTNRVLIVSLVLLLFIVVQIRQITAAQSSTLALTEVVDKLEIQTKDILPAVSDSTRIFASRFLLSPSYFTPAASVWYAEPYLTGGDLSTFKEYPFATNEFYVFDYEDGHIYNLMPELQDHRKTYVLWKNKPILAVNSELEGMTPPLVDAVRTDVIAGPAGDSMIGISQDVEAPVWTSIGYDAIVPINSTLAVSIMALDALEYRVRMVDETGNESVLLHEDTVDSARNSWTDIELPLAEFGGQQVKIFFDARAENAASAVTVYWGDPRIFSD